MAYDDLKEHEGQAYSGMRVGGAHRWDYPDGRWDEVKAAPDRWDFTFRSTKRRVHRAPEGSGAPPGTEFHWYLLGHQRVRKVDADTYETFLEGVKHKVAHKRPHWHRWSSEYPGRPSERQRVLGILEEAAARLRAQPEPQRRLDNFLAAGPEAGEDLGPESEA